MSFYNVLCKFAFDKDFKVILDACQSTPPYPSCSYIVPPATIVGVAKSRIMPVMDKLADYTKKWEETQDPKVWLEGAGFRDELYELDTYSKMETTLQKNFETLQ